MLEPKTKKKNNKQNKNYDFKKLFYKNAFWYLEVFQKRLEYETKLKD
jgi:hypothetical protein